MIKTQTNVYDSSTIEASTYDFKTKELFVVFKHATYIYKDVHVVDYSFANATSQGIALNSVIKGTYSFEKIEDVESYIATCNTIGAYINDKGEEDVKA